MQRKEAPPELAPKFTLRTFRQSRRQSTQPGIEENEIEAAIVSVYSIFMMQLASLLTMVLVCAYALPELDAEGFYVTRMDVLLSYAVLVGSLVFMLISNVITLPGIVSIMVFSVYAFAVDYIISIITSRSPLLSVVGGIVVSLILWMCAIAVSFVVVITNVDQYHLHLGCSLLILIVLEVVLMLVDVPLEIDLFLIVVNLAFCFVYALYAHQTLLSDDFLDMLYENRKNSTFLSCLLFAIYSNILLRSIVLTSTLIGNYVDIQLY